MSEERSIKRNGKTFKGYSTTDKVFYHIQTVLAVLVTLIMFFPFYWMLVTSFKSGDIILDGSFNLLPTEISFDSYIEAWNRVPLGRYIVNTIIVTSIVMVFKITFGVLAAYGFARGRFPGREALFYLVLGAMMVPHQVVFIPLYVLCARLGWIDTYAGLVLPSIIAPRFIFMLRQSFKAVDQDYIDAGRIDGMGTLGAIRYIMVPMCKSTLMTVTLTTFIGEWNSYFWPRVITQSDRFRVITIGLVHLRESFGAESWLHSNVTMAGAVITMIPAVVLFFVFQKYMLTGYSKVAMK